MTTSDNVDKGCSILLIAGTLRLGLDLAKRMKDGGSVPEDKGTDVYIPWTISNKYYTAPVHIGVHQLGNVTADLISEEVESQPPALILVWEDDEPYMSSIKTLRDVMSAAQYEPEVALAVRVGEKEVEDEDELDSTLLENGFEYVNAEKGGLRRVVDAVSTIMWGSMSSAGSSKEQELMLSELMEEARLGEMESTDDFGLGFEDDFVEVDEVVASLREIRRELGNLSDEEEKRKRAARIALSLVYDF